MCNGNDNKLKSTYLLSFQIQGIQCILYTLHAGTNLNYSSPSHYSKQLFSKEHNTESTQAGQRALLLYTLSTIYMTQDVRAKQNDGA